MLVIFVLGLLSGAFVHVSKSVHVASKSVNPRTNKVIHPQLLTSKCSHIFEKSNASHEYWFHQEPLLVGLSITELKLLLGEPDLVDCRPNPYYRPRHPIQQWYYQRGKESLHIVVSDGRAISLWHTIDQTSKVR